MARVGILGEDDRVELIDEGIGGMASIGPALQGCIDPLASAP